MPELLKTAAEAIKPASSFIDALIAPKVKRLRRWAEERDLQGRLEDPDLEARFQAYLKRLLRRASSTTTVVFPQRSLLLPDIYEPVTLVDTAGNQPVDLRTVGDGFRAQIVDDAGMGKSTYARHLVLEVCCDGIHLTGGHKEGR